MHTSPQRSLLACFHLCRLTFQNSRRLHCFGFDDPNPTLTDGPERKLGLIRNTELPHGNDVKRNVQNVRNFRSDRNPTARKPEHHRTRFVPDEQTRRQLTTGIGAIHELHGS